ncbi:MAG: MGMT family protein [Cytophagales bacterium]
MDKYSFFSSVFDVVKLIPEGRVTSYGAIAKYLGAKSGARMVGWALNQSITNKDPIPAHRVVNRQGLLTGKIHFPGDSMERELKKEGLIIENDKILNFRERFWDPETELDVLN